jgi:hypothetical protein
MACYEQLCGSIIAKMYGHRLLLAASEPEFPARWSIQAETVVSLGIARTPCWPQAIFRFRPALNVPASVYFGVKMPWLFPNLLLFSNFLFELFMVQLRGPFSDRQLRRSGRGSHRAYARKARFLRGRKSHPALSQQPTVFLVFR